MSRRANRPSNAPGDAVAASAQSNAPSMDAVPRKRALRTRASDAIRAPPPTSASASASSGGGAAATRPKPGGRVITADEMDRIMFKLSAEGTAARRDEVVREREAELRVVMDQHDMAVKEKFHLERYVSILEGWDPAEARVDNSPVFLDYKNANHSLLDLVAANSARSSPAAGSSRRNYGPSRTTRRQLHVRSEALGIANGDKAAKAKAPEAETTPSKGKGKERAASEVKERETASPVVETKRGRRSQAAEMPPPPAPKGKKSRRATIAEPEEPDESEEETPVKGKKRGRQSMPNLPAAKKARSLRGAKAPSASPASPASSPAPTPARSPSPVATPAPLPSLAHLPFPPPPARPAPKRTRHGKFVYTDPGQRPPPPKFGGQLEPLLESYLYIEDVGPVVDVAALEARAAREGYVRNRVNYLQHQGRLLRLLDEDDEGPPQPKERDRSHQRKAPVGPPARQTDYRDSLLAHMVQVRNAMLAEAKAKPVYCKRIARMVQMYWEHLANKDERERVAAERELKRKAKEVVKAMRKRWGLAIKIVRAKVLAAQKLEQDRLGKEHLQNMLQRSTGLLEAQRDDIVGRSVSAEADGDSDAASDATDEVSAAEDSEEEGDDEVGQGDEGGEAEKGDDEQDRAAVTDGQSPRVAAEMEPAQAEVSETNMTAEDSTAVPVDEAEGAEQTVDDAAEDETEAPADDASQANPDARSEADEELSDSESADEDAIDLRILLDENVEPEPAADGEDERQEDQASAEPTAADEAAKEPEAAGDDAVLSGEVATQADETEPAVKRSASAEPVDVTQAVDESTAVAEETEPNPTPDEPLRPRSRRMARKRALADVNTPDPDANDAEFAAADDLDQEDEQLDVEMTNAAADDSDDENAGLLADADLPIEELMKRYGNPVPAASDAGVDGVKGADSSPAPNDQSLTDAALAGAKRESPPLIVEGKRQRRARTVWTPPDDQPQHLPSRPKKAKVEVVEPESDVDMEPTPELSSEEETDEEDEGEDEEEEEGKKEPEDPNAPRLKPPFLLRGTLRPYQHAGLEWLASLYANNMNGILADEMGLGKTIQTIALLGHLACDLGVWGPHLIIVPTSVILNWEMEFKRFLPGMKVLTYYGNQKERKEKRVGWNTENAWQVCITSYQIVLADQHIFRRKNWVYMILDEAHNIKNFRSQRWQTLLGFKTQRRLLLTGTPLQNNLMELWSLLYFLMPNGITADATAVVGFANHKEFMEWFSNPMDKAVESGETMDEETVETVNKLHTLLRPFILRRLKSEVETQLPGKFEHVVYCRLSKRQRFLYDEFMSRASTREALSSGGYLGVVNILMQLRKVCNHPDLFEVRPVRTSFAMDKGVTSDFEPTDLLVRKRLLETQDELDLASMKLLVTGREGESGWVAAMRSKLDASDKLPHAIEPAKKQRVYPPKPNARTPAGWAKYRAFKEHEQSVARWRALRDVNRRRCQTGPIYGITTLEMLRDLPRLLLPADFDQRRRIDRYGEHLPPAAQMVHSFVDRLQRVTPVIDRFAVIPPNAVARDVATYALPGVDPLDPQILEPGFDSLHLPTVKLQIAFPDASLLQYDCGKLQKLAEMLRDLKAGGHRVLIFTQMTRVLDILEIFLSYNGHRYLRLDGSTKIEDRQVITERFNSDSRIFCFIASSRSGGVGINLTGADTVFFYDSDWNPSMDRQCMDRAHRIGQTREVHIYRFVSSHTVEENMLKKANQKRLLDRVVIQEGGFTTDFFGKMDWRDMLDDDMRAEAAGGGAGVGEGEGQDRIEDVAVEPEPEAEDVAAHAEHFGQEREFAAALAEVEDEEDAAAARVAQGEGEMDFAEFDDDKRGGAGGATPAGGKEKRDVRATSASASASASAPPRASAVPSRLESASAAGTPSALDLADDADADDYDYDEDEPGAADEYMLRFVEWDWDHFSQL